MSAIHALHLASVLNDQDPDKGDTANVTAFPYAEIIRLLSELCDVSSAVNVLSKLENHNRNTELGSIQNLLAKATVYNCLGEVRFAVSFLNNKVALRFCFHQI